jgi:tetratricopeptide (TPR) repeat protein
MLLIQTLTDQDPAAAAAEARRTALLLPGDPRLRVLSARAWLRAGDGKAAREDLNEAIARDPNGVETRLLLAEINLQDGKPEAALEHVDSVIKNGSSADALFLRAVARAALGGAEGTAQDLAEIAKLEPAPTNDVLARRYAVAARIVHDSTKSSLEDERSLMQRALVRRKDEAVKDELERLVRLARARTALLSGLIPPVTHRPSHERRLLAFRLIGQSLTDLAAFIEDGDEDTLSEARINLGEAIKHANGAAEDFAKEQK